MKENRLQSEPKFFSSISIIQYSLSTIPSNMQTELSCNLTSTSEKYLSS